MVLTRNLSSYGSRHPLLLTDSVTLRIPARQTNLFGRAASRIAMSNGEYLMENSTESHNLASDQSSISDLKMEIKSLVRRKFELETKIASTEPQKFGDLLDIIEIPSPPSRNNDLKEEIQRLQSAKKQHFYKLCGMHATSEGDETRVCFSSVHDSKEYSIWVKKHEDRIEVTKHILPPMVPLEELIDTHLKNTEKASSFFRKIYHYIVVYGNRIIQFNDFKNAEDTKNIEFFSSHSAHFVKLKIPLRGEFSRALNIHLKYPADFIYPQTLLLVGGCLTDEAKKNLLGKCKVFKEMPLLIAFREVFPFMESL